MIEVVKNRVVVNPNVVEEAGLQNELPISQSGDSYILDKEIFEEYQQELKVASASVEANQEDYGYDDQNNPFWGILYQVQFQNSAGSDLENLIQMQEGTLKRKTATFNSLEQLEKYPVGREFEGATIIATDETWEDERGNSGTVNQIVREDQAVATETEENTPQPNQQKQTQNQQQTQAA